MKIDLNNAAPMEYRTLRDIPAARASFARLGCTVKKAKGRLNGRPAFWITEPDHHGGKSCLVTDYGLLERANNS